MKFDPAAMDRAYNPRPVVPDHQDYLARWTASSRAARLGEPCYLDIACGDAPGQNLDLFPARAARGPAPLLVFIHGGYWRGLDKSDFSFVAPAFTRAGAAVAVINYRLVPKVTLEDLVRDVLMAVTWCYLHGGQYGADPQRLVVAGHSAGGHLTAMMLACQWPRWHGALPANVVKGGLAVSGLYDLEPLMHAPFLNVDIGLTPERLPRLSPGWMPPATHAPLITAVGGAETEGFHYQNDFIAKAWSAVRRRDVAMPGHNHFSICDALATPGTPLNAAALELLGL
jgi:arylformamidase